jgi:hypothetical protein
MLTTISRASAVREDLVASWRTRPSAKCVDLLVDLPALVFGVCDFLDCLPVLGEAGEMAAYSRHYSLDFAKRRTRDHDRDER